MRRAGRRKKAYLLLIVMFCSCSNAPSSITRDDLRSELKTTLSYAAMLNLMIGQHAQRSTSVTFDSVQAHYLADQLSSELSSLEKKRPSPSIVEHYTASVDALKQLHAVANDFQQRPSSVPLRDSIAKMTSELVPVLTNVEQSL